MEQCNDLLERPPNNSFTMHNFQCPKEPLLDQLHKDMPGGGGGRTGFQVTGMIEWGQKPWTKI